STLILFASLQANANLSTASLEGPFSCFGASGLEIHLGMDRGQNYFSLQVNHGDGVTSWLARYEVARIRRSASAISFVSDSGTVQSGSIPDGRASLILGVRQDMIQFSDGTEQPLECPTPQDAKECHTRKCQGSGFDTYDYFVPQDQICNPGPRSCK